MGALGPKMTNLTCASPAQHPSPLRGGWSSAGRRRALPGTCVSALSGPACRLQALGTGHQEPGGCTEGPATCLSSSSERTSAGSS